MKPVIGLVGERGNLEEGYKYDAYGLMFGKRFNPQGADFDADGDVDLVDYDIFATAYPSNPTSNPLTDLNDDGRTELGDYGVFAVEYGDEAASPIDKSNKGNPYQFTGRPLYYFVVDDDGTERELRLADHRRRHYDMLHGRWLQRDPLGALHPLPGFRHLGEVHYPGGWARHTPVAAVMARLLLLEERLRRLTPYLSPEALPTSFDYVDGMNLYEYAMSSPCAYSDVLGMKSEEKSCAGETCTHPGATRYHLMVASMPGTEASPDTHERWAFAIVLGVSAGYLGAGHHPPGRIAGPEDLWMVWDRFIESLTIGKIYSVWVKYECCECKCKGHLWWKENKWVSVKKSGWYKCPEKVPSPALNDAQKFPGQIYKMRDKD